MMRTDIEVAVNEFKSKSGPDERRELALAVRAIAANNDLFIFL